MEKAEQAKPNLSPNTDINPNILKVRVSLDK